MNLPDWILNSEKILIAPLNWGLGHASRCIPIINYLLAKGKKLYLASDGEALLLLQKEFPDIISYDLPGYNIKYRYDSMEANILMGGINILAAVSREHSVIKKVIKKHSIDAIISDNRYGVRAGGCKNVIICHQLNIKGNAITSAVATKINHYWINKFDECWIPDFPPPASIGGELTEPHGIVKYNFVGPLTRFKKLNCKIKRQVLVVLSGPEPKRTQLEKKLRHILRGMDYLLIRGVVNEDKIENKRVKNYLTSETLNQEICASDWVISRSGYSTIMDLTEISKKAILIPTPGQSEQVYLAKQISEDKNPLFQILEEDHIENIKSILANQS